MKTALVLSGGGAKGAFQAGAMEVLAAKGFEYNSIAGVSVGALNGTMVAAGRIPRMMELWRTISQDQIYKKKSVWHLLAQYGLYKLGIASPPKSFYSNDPLFKLLQKEFKKIELHVPLNIGRVYLETGEYYNEIDSDSSYFVKTLLASTAIPVIWTPVMIKNATFVDGGIRNMTPLADVIPSGPDRIVVIPTNPLSSLRKDESIRDIIAIARRALEIVLNEVFLEDIKRCMQINYLVKQAAGQGVTLYRKNGEPYKYYELMIIEPPEPLGSALNFDRDRLDRLIRMGREAARKVLNE